jgi:AcrR family transcriptional regulator
MNSENNKPDKRVAILEATLELIAEQGFHNTPTSQIAKKACVGVGSIYRYFQDKDELIHELFHYVIKKESLAILKEHDPEAPFREQYIQLCTRMIKFSIEHPKESRFLEQYFNSPYGISRRQEDLLKQEHCKTKKPPLAILFEKAKAQQVIKDLPPLILGALTFGPIFALLRDILAGLIEYDAEVMYKAVEACWDAIKR